MRFLRSVYLVAGYCWTIALAVQAPASAQEPGASPAKPLLPTPAEAVPAQQAPSVALPAPVQPVDPNAGQTPAPNPAPATAPPAADTATPEPATAPENPDAPGAGARLAKRKGVVVAPSHDAERPPAPPEPEAPSETGFAARLSLGVGGALWISGGESKLSKPFWFGLDLGYAFTRELTVFARGTSWFPYDNLANEFFGLGAAYRLVAEHVYIAPAIGLSFVRQGTASEWTHYFQGLAFEADVGQYIPITDATNFSFGAHFQIGTPAFGKKPDAFTSLQAGIFVALGLH